MGRITAIEPQKRRPNRRSVFVDGEFAAGVDQEVVLVLGLRVGQQVDDGRLREVLRSEEVRQAREAALNLLGFRSRSSRELETRLRQKGYEDDIIADVISGLERVDLVNDERFAGEWVRSRMASRPMGKRALSWELRRKGISNETIGGALEDVGEQDEYDAALSLAESRAAKGPDIDLKAERRRVAGLLQRRGFDWDTVNRVLAVVFKADDDE
jgi:regulatory protein